jgi:carboxypeptidase family protein
MKKFSTQERGHGHPGPGGGQPGPSRGSPPAREPRARGLRRIPLAFILIAAFLASLVAAAGPAAASGPGTIVSYSGSMSLTGSFAGTSSGGGDFSYAFTAPSWVASIANAQGSGTITPSTAADSALTSLGAASCILRVTTFDVTVKGGNPSPQTINLGYQLGPMQSAFPLNFATPQLYIGPLTAVSPGTGEITAYLKSIKGTVQCRTSSGAPVAASDAVSYQGGTSGKQHVLFLTSTGSPPPDGALTGQVTDSSSNPIAGATVEACTIGYQCTSATTAANGTYSVSVQPGPYYVWVAPPASITNLDHGSVGPITVTSSVTSAGNNVILDPVAPLPSNVTMPANGSNLPVTPPTEYWGAPFTVTVTGCPGGTASWEVQGWNTQTVTYQTLTGTLTETPPGSGSYTGTIPALYPIHGEVVYTLTITCPNGTTETTQYKGYIDPSGTVVNQDGVPVPGATVTLYNSSSLTGPWTQVPNGDTAIMSPSNTDNPSPTDSQGRFGWDVTAGDYKLTATAPGCSSASTQGLPVPPPQINLILILTCKNAVSSWTADPGGGITGKGKITLTDTTTEAKVTCVTTLKGTLTAGSGLDGTGLATVTALNLTKCAGPAGLTFQETSNALPWPVNALSYDAGVTAGDLSGIDATLGGTSNSCSVTVDGPAAGADNGWAGITYTNKTHELNILSTSGNLHFGDVSNGCLGAFNDGDTATANGTYQISPAQTITGQ